jgi:UDP-GlcNAc:undecaprenyl-phosphate GlcNAc-1-phosphate transferase
VTAPGSAGLTPVDALTSLVLMFSVAFLLSLVLTPLVRDHARRRGLLDCPDGRRKAHPVAVPRLGGVAVYLSFVAAFGLSLLVLRDSPWYGGHALGAYVHLVVACTAVMLMGVVDDLIGITPLAKIVVQAAAGFYLYHYGGYQIRLISHPVSGETVALGGLSLPLTLLWFVGMSNAFNLIDGLDGLAAGVGVFSSSLVFIYALINERWEIALLAVALGGALLGFLRYNFSPATVFLGDSGSLFVGVALAALALRGSTKASAAVSVAAPLIAFGLPLLDAALALVRRVVRGRSILEADADHIHHRIVRRGLTPQRAVVLLYAVTALFGVLSLLAMTGRAHVTGLVTLAFTVVTWTGIRLLGGVREDGAAGSRGTARSRLRLREAAGPVELWDALVEAGARLNFDRLVLRLSPGGEPGASPDRWNERSWEGRTAVDLASAWSWTVPLATDGATLGELTVTRSVEGPRARQEMAETLEALAEDLVEALVRLGERAARDEAAKAS